MSILETLKERHLFEDITHPKLAEALYKPLCVYAGFDPSNDSLQAGNFVTIMVLSHLQRAGHKIITLVGGATGLIGDPSGKSSERNLLSPEQVEYNLKGIKENLARFIDFNPDSPNPAIMVNNYDWFKSITFLDLLRDVGPYFRLGVMLGKESVKKRMEAEDGMSFTEFCYQILQGYDFLHLYRNYGCTLQIGGSDQWGNITSGTELIRRVCNAEAYGMIFPLVCDSSGNKFGKSEGNAVFLDADKTSVYDFYQFFMRTQDADVIRYLKIFSFLPLDEIAELEKNTVAAPEKRLAQQVLADELTRMVHGSAGLAAAKQATAVLFGGSLSGLSARELESIFADVPSAELSWEEIKAQPLVDIVTAAGMFASKSEARRLMQQGGLYVNNQRITEHNALLTHDNLVEGRLAVLRSGKKSFFLIKLLSAATKVGAVR